MCVAWIQVFAGYIASLRLLTNMFVALPPFPGHFAPPKWNMGTQKKTDSVSKCGKNHPDPFFGIPYLSLEPAHSWFVIINMMFRSLMLLANSHV